MKKIPSIAYLIAALSVSGTAIAADPIVMDLWPGKPPGDLPVRGEEKVFVRDSPLYGTNLLITNVTKPTLTVYLPAKADNTGTAMVVCPGGGYWDLFWDKEGEQVASWLSFHGMTAIILKYRVPRPPNVPEDALPIGPQMDAQRAVSTVRSHAAEWGINPKRIGIVGFSMGAHLSAATATNFNDRTYKPIDAIDDVSCRPDFAVLCYPDWLTGARYGKSRDELSPAFHIPAGTPPILLIHATDDTTANAENSAIMYLALKRAGIPVELHIFAKGEHDFGVRQNETLPSSWPHLCIKWMRSFGLLEVHP
jgi:acetyl esterase/lipase